MASLSGELASLAIFFGRPLDLALVETGVDVAAFVAGAFRGVVAEIFFADARTGDRAGLLAEVVAFFAALRLKTLAGAASASAAAFFADLTAFLGERRSGTGGLGDRCFRPAVAFEGDVALDFAIFAGKLVDLRIEGRWMVRG